jgi:predicted NBD/HSP70 family sugar kinase
MKRLGLDIGGDSRKEAKRGFELNMKNMSASIYGGIEAGGTKFICAVGTGPKDLLVKRFETTTPQKTIDEVIKFFQPYTVEEAVRRVAAIGIASFGPLDLNKNSPRYGHIINTPKPGWTNINLANIISTALVAWNLEANYIAIGTYNLICTLSPQRIILGGGIMRHHGLLEAIQRKVEKLLNKYLPALESFEEIGNYLVHPALEDVNSDISLSGVLGAIILAKRMHLVND